MSLIKEELGMGTVEVRPQELRDANILEGCPAYM
jgi:hypothetical protein